MYGYNNNRIIAIGDIHGDFDMFVNLLIMAGVINKNLKWIGRDTYVIQLGDTLDGKRPDVNIDKSFLKEPQEIKINNLILYLNRQAKKDGGRVISILGNHELYPYYFYNDEKFNRDYVKTSDIQQYKRLYKVSRFNYYKPGKGEGAILFGRTRPLMIKLGEFLFCHGSIGSKFIQNCLKYGYSDTRDPNKINIVKINKAVKDWLIGDRKKAPFMIDANDDVNPLFNRELTNPKSLSQRECDKLIEGIFPHLPGIKYIVMGHSTHKKINTICYDRIYRTDIAISRAFGGTLETNIKKMQVLEIKQNKTGVKTNIITPYEKIPIIN